MAQRIIRIIKLRHRVTLRDVVQVVHFTEGKIQRDTCHVFLIPHPHHHHHFPLTLKAEASGPLTNVVQNMPKGRARGVDAISSGMSHHVTIVAYSFSSNLGTWNSQPCLVPPGWLSLLSSVLIICSKFWIPESLQITSCSDLDPLQSTS